MKSFAKPPEKVQLTLEAVLLLLKEKSGWDVAKRVMSDSAFLTRLRNYDKDNIPEGLSKKLQKWINDENFTPEIIAATSTACKSLCLWVRAIDKYSKVAHAGAGVEGEASLCNAAGGGGLGEALVTAVVTQVGTQLQTWTQSALSDAEEGSCSGHFRGNLNPH